MSCLKNNTCMKIYSKKFERISVLNDEKVSWSIDAPVIEAEKVFGNIEIKHCNKIQTKPRVDILEIPDAVFAMLADSEG